MEKSYRQPIIIDSIKYIDCSQLLPYCLDLDEGVSSFTTSRGCEIFVKALKLSSGDLTTSLTECLRGLCEEGDVVILNLTTGPQLEH